MTNQRTRAFNPNAINGLKIESIIGAPLVAASLGNSMMLKEQTKFLMDFCFTRDGDTYHPVMIEMSLTRSVLEPGMNPGDSATMKNIITSFSLPLITIVPINSLAVNSVSVDFEMELTSQHTVSSESGNTIAKQFGTPDEKTQLQGRISYDSKENVNQSRKSQSQRQNSSKLKVSLNAGPLPLPIGVTTLLDMYTKSILPVPVKSIPEKTDNEK